MKTTLRKHARKHVSLLALAGGMALVANAQDSNATAPVSDGEMRAEKSL
jgi:hypothetical protein